MAATRSDQAFLSGDPQFVNRVRQSLVAAAVAIASEGYAIVFHKNRAKQCVYILNNPDLLKPMYSIAVATDANVIADATVGGTVALTGGNVATQAALATDAHIDAAVSGQFNAFFDTST